MRVRWTRSDPLRLFSRSAILCIAGLFFVLAHVFAQSVITTDVGPQLPVSGNPALNQGVDLPSAVVPDGVGGVYVVSANQNRVYDISVDGKLRLVAGSTYGFAGDGGHATNAKLAGPSGIARDSSGNLYIADTHNYRIRRVTAGGVITTIAGTGNSGFSGDGGPAISAQLSGPQVITVDQAGNIYFVDNDRIRQIDTKGVITTVAGGGTAQALTGVAATSALLPFSPTGLAVDTSGNLYIASGFLLRVGPDGLIKTLAQRNGTQGGRAGFVCTSSGDGDFASAANVCYPNGLAVDAAGNLYLTDGERVREITTEGLIHAVAGGPTCNVNAPDGSSAASVCLNPFSLAVDDGGNLYISEAIVNRLRKVSPDGILTTILANTIRGFSGDGGPATSAQISGGPIALDASGNLYIGDLGNSRVRKVTVNGVITTIAGNGNFGFAGDGGPATSAELKTPLDVFVDSSNNVYILDEVFVRKVTPDGIINTIAGCYGVCGPGPSALQTVLSVPQRIAVDATGALYIAEADRVLKVGLDGVASTVVTFDRSYHVRGFALNPSGGFYISAGDNFGDSRIQKVASDGSITTIAASGPCDFSGQDDGGPAASAHLCYPFDIKLDAAGNIYISESNRIRKISTSGIINTIAGGIILSGFSGDGGPATSAQLNSELGGYLAVDPAGNLYIADGNWRVRKVYNSTCATTPEPLMTLNLQPGFYIAEVRNQPGTAGGFWGMEIRTQLGSLAGGFDLGGGTFTSGGLTSFGAFYFPSGGTVHIKVNAQVVSGTGPFSITLRLLDAAHHPIVPDQAAGTRAEFDTPALAPGFYVVEVRTPENAPVATYQMQIGAPGIGVVADAGGYVNDRTVGFGAFYISQTQDVAIKLFGTSAYGAEAAPCTALTLRDASGQVVQTAP